MREPEDGGRGTRRAGTRRVASEPAAHADADALGLTFPSRPADALAWRRSFAGEPSQLGAVRRWVESLLPECPSRDEVTLVATELGTNACLHSASARPGGTFTVELTWEPSSVRVGVEDLGAATAPRVIDDPEAEHGRGLLVVAGLSIRTGAVSHGCRRRVWAVLPWAGPSPARPGPAALARSGPAEVHP